MISGKGIVLDEKLAKWSLCFHFPLNTRRHEISREGIGFLQKNVAQRDGEPKGETSGTRE